MIKDYNRQLIHTLHSFFWYEGLLDQEDDEWVDFKFEADGKEYKYSRPKYKEDDFIHRLIKDLRNYNHNTIKYYTRQDGDKLFDEDEYVETFNERYSMFWQMLVEMFGNCGTSPRTGWIENRDECADFLEMVVQYKELSLEDDLNDNK